MSDTTSGIANEACYNAANTLAKQLMLPVAQAGHGIEPET